MKKFAFLLLIQICIVPFAFVKAGESFPLDTIFPLVNEYNNKISPDIIANDSNYFLVWENVTPSNHKTIWGTRIFSNGDVEYKNGILIADSSESPVILPFGDEYMIFYKKNDKIYEKPLLIYGNAYIVGAENIIDVTPSITGDYKVCYNNGKFGLFYQGDVGYFTVIDSFGNAVVNPETVLMDNDDQVVDISTDGNNYLLLWYKNSNANLCLYGTRVTNTGNVIDTLPIKISADSNFMGNLSVHFNGENYMVVWLGEDHNIYGNIIDTSGAVFDSTGFPIAQYPGRKEDPLLSYNGQNYLTIYDVNSFYTALRGTRFTKNGVVIDTPGFNITNYINTPMKIGFNDNGSMICWSGKYNNLNEIHGVRLSSEGNLIDTNDIIVTKPDSFIDTSFAQITPSSAYNPNTGKYLVVWGDNRNFPGDKTDLYGALVDTLGDISSVFPIAKRIWGEGSPKVIYGKDRWFVAWEYDCKVYATTILNDGTVSEPDGKCIFSDINAGVKGFSISSIGNKFITVLRTSPVSPSDECYIRYILLDSLADTTSAEDIEWGANWPTFSGVSVSSGDSMFFITYSALYSCCNVNRDGIYLYRLKYDGTPADTGVLELKDKFKSCSKSEYADNRLMLTWVDGQDGNKNLYGAIYDSLGNLLDDSIVISSANGNQTNPTLAYGNKQFIVIWEDYRNNDKGDLYGAKIKLDGTISDSEAIVTGDSADISPDLELGTENQMFLTYSKWTDTVNGTKVNNMRVWCMLDPFLDSVDTLKKDTTVDTTVNDSGKIVNLMANPFSDYVFGGSIYHITFNYHLYYGTNVKLDIYNISGVRVFDYDNYSNQGLNHIDVNVSKIPGGIYFYKFKAGTVLKKGKIMILH